MPGPPLVLAVVGTILLGTGCVSFASVKQTAALGNQLSAHEAAFDMAPALCRAGNTRKEPDAACSDLEGDLENWHRVNRVLVAYAKALDRMADDSKDMSDKDDVATLVGTATKIGTWGSTLTTQAAAGVKAGVDGLIAETTGFYRRAKLKGAITRSNAAVQAISRAIVMNIDALDHADQNTGAVVATTDAAIGDVEPQLKNGMHFALTITALSLTSDRAELNRYRKAILAFAAAHEVLARQIDDVGQCGNDRIVLWEIGKSVGPIISSATP